jgi:hypothetical protein
MNRWKNEKENLRKIENEKKKITSKLSGDEPIFTDLTYFEILTIIDQKSEGISTDIDIISDSESDLKARIKLQDFAEHLEDGKAMPRLWFLYLIPNRW